MSKEPTTPDKAIRKRNTLTQQRGFALIACISILSLCVMIALAMVSLATTTSKETYNRKAMEEARANARLALSMAISKLQLYTGSDTRITAPADLLVADAPPLTGVWKSWEGTNHDSQGRPIKPDYGVKRLDSKEADSRFVGFLVSSAGTITDPLSTNLSTVVATSASDKTVALLSSGSLGTNPGQVHVVPNLIDEGAGSYAWWVSSENQKAKIIQPYAPREDSPSGVSELAKSHAVPDLGEFGLDAYLADPEDFFPVAADAKPLAKAFSRNTVDLLNSTNPSSPHLNFHDYSTSADGLLTNVATGGWRKDLTLLSETWDDTYTKFSGGGLPLFRYSPASGDTSSVPKPTVTNYDLEQIGIYPWSNFTQIGERKFPSTYHTASSSWQSLANFLTFYKKISLDSSTGIPQGPFGWKTPIRPHRRTVNSVPKQHFYNYYHEEQLNPVLARVQLIIQGNMVVDGSEERLNRGHRLNLRMVPVVTLWNPYNVELKKELKGAEYQQHVDPDFGIGTERSLPMAMAVINGTNPPANGFDNQYRMMTRGNIFGLDGPNAGVRDIQLAENTNEGIRSEYFRDIRSFGLYLPLEFSLKPGEVKSFTPAANSTAIFGSGGMRLKEGFQVADNFGLMIKDPNDLNEESDYNSLHQVTSNAGGKRTEAADIVRFKFRADRFIRMYTDAISPDVGGGGYFALGTPEYPLSNAAMKAGEVPKAVAYFRTIMAMNPHMDWNRIYWPNDDLRELQYQVRDLIPGNGNPDWTNLYTVSIGPRFTMGQGYGSKSNRPTRGVLMNNPVLTNSLTLPYKQAYYHPANNPVEMSYSSMALNDPLSPEVGKEGYIATGFQAGDGLSKMVLAEVPVTPVASLAELQGWDVRGGNPLPPHQFNIIGNSEANPLIAQDGILAKYSYSSDIAENLQHDDAYCANHLLFDDWFFSTITEMPASLGSGSARDINSVYRDFLMGKNRLINRAYRPIREDFLLTSARASERIDDIINSSEGDGFLKVASRFEVDGMFNVNSTSVKAWRALLGHARSKQVAYHTEDGVEVDPDTYDYVVSRNSVASDVKAGNEPGAGSIFPKGSEYTGFRTFTGEQLDELAEKIVEQVRARGPFLSLSEFVNRQLSENDDLSIAGALQVALDSLNDDPNVELKLAANQLSEETMDPNDPVVSENGRSVAGYAYPKAAEGYSTHGFPGWIRQADVLRPLAPVLSARDDTFTIRAYGDARDQDGNVTAQAWAEATVKRTRDFIDDSDDADRIDPPQSSLNQALGRRYRMVSFRWLNPSEV